MKSVSFINMDIRISCNAHKWALPIGASFGKKLFSIHILCFEIEFDWISEKDIEDEEV